MAEIKWEPGKLNGAPNKVKDMVQFHTGDLVYCLQRRLFFQAVENASCTGQ